MNETMNETRDLRQVLAKKEKEIRELTERCRYMTSLFEVNSLIHSTLDLHSLLALILSTSENVMRVEASTIMLLNQEKQELYMEVVRGKAGQKMKDEFRLKVGEGIAGWVAQKGEALWVPDAYKDDRFNPEFDQKSGFKTRSILCAPLKLQDRIIGVGQIINKKDGSDFSHLDLEMFSLFCGIAAVAIEKARMHQFALEKEGFDRELNLAQEIQKTFLPTEFPGFNKIKIGARNRPARFVAGDFFEVFGLDKGRVGVVLGDVSGKGVHAALYAARLLGNIGNFARQEKCPAKTLNRVNQELVKRRTKGMFATILYLILDPNNQKIFYANAGHLPPIYINQTQKEVSILCTDSGPPAGIIDDQDYPVLEKEIKGDGFLCMVTDGITESEQQIGGEFVGLEGTKKIFEEILEHPEYHPEDLIDYSVGRFRSQMKLPKDDATIVVSEVIGW